MILVIAMVLVLLSTAVPSSAESRSYIGSCANSFYTTSRIKIEDDYYFRDDNTYAKLSSTSGSNTVYYSNLVLFTDETYSTVHAHDQMLLVSGHAHDWNWSRSSSDNNTYYLKLQVKNFNTGYTTFVSGSYYSYPYIP